MTNVLKPNNPESSLLPLVIAFGAFVLFLFIISRDAVNHPVHAIEIDDGRFIHGWGLECEEVVNTPNKYRCQTSLNGKLLEVRVWPRFPTGSDGPLRCNAQFDSRGASCEAAYITSSYWQHGIQISGSSELAEAYKQAPVWRKWPNIIYGWAEFEYVQLGATFTIFYTMLAFTIIFKRRRNLQSLPIWLTAILIGMGLVFLSFFLSPRFIPPLFQPADHTYWEVWGLPLLMLAGFLITGAYYGKEKDETGFESAMVFSLVSSAVIYFLTFGVMIVLLLSLNFID
ncbi:MAG: hypothetical protein AAGD96_34270 [Chloroflexota bacterium]